VEKAFKKRAGGGGVARAAMMIDGSASAKVKRYNALESSESY